MTDSNKKLPSFDDLVDVHRMTPQKVLQVLQVDAENGLSNEEVIKRQEFYGKNEFPPEKGTPLWLMILKQFSDALVLILIGAALISFVLAFFEEGEEASTAFVEPLVIVFILIVNATVGVLQESGAEDAVEALKKFDPEKATVIRGGQAAEIQAEELVPGDIVEVAVGDQIPADIRVIALHASAVDAEQALLTGESVPVEKITEALDKPDALVQDKRNMMFSGTTVSRGKARGIVTGTGLRTEKGKIRDRLAAKQESSFPLKERLDKFGQNLSVSIGVICAVVWLINIPHFSDPALGGWLKGAIFYFKVAVSLAVAAIPEGLPAVITTCLALGTQRMAKRGAIVTALPAVETLGCTNVICSDKTGTLTTNQMSVLQFFVVGDNKKSKEIVEFKVDGTTYSPFDDHGLLCNVHCLGDYSSVNLKKNQRVDVPATLPSVERLARICALNNDSSVVKKEDGTYDKLGQPTEASMKVLVEKLLLSDPKQIAQLKNQTNLACPVNNHWEKSHQKLAVLEFNRQRKSMSVLVKDNNGAKTLLVKGAWDAVLSRCTNVNVNGQVVALDERLRKDLEKKVIDYCEGENNFRCLVLAERENIKDEAAFTKAKAEDFEKLESGLTFVGVVAILDPPRPEVRESIEKCKTAGIRVIVITGDNKATAVSICKKIGVFDVDEDTNDKAFTGAEWKKLTEDQKNAAVKSAKLFARVEPIDKQDLVKYLHKHNMVVAMTGDGVNDAPALAEADIGIAMGTGTAVAKGAAKMVLANDNFATIVAAVEEGRNIYNNTKQFIRYLICSNIGEVVSIFTTAVLGLPEVLLPVQLLWVNLVTDGLPAVALGFNKPEEGIMIQKPRPRDEPIVTRWTLIRYLVVGTYIGLATVAGMVWWYMFYEQGPKLAWEDLFLWSKCQANTVSHGRSIDCSIFHDNNPNTVALSVLVTIEMFQALNSLSENSSLLSRRSHPFSNPHLLGAMALSFGLHFLILYVPMFAKLFSVAPINWVEWQAVILLSAPVILVDEFLKVISRTFLVDNVKPKSD